MNDCFFDTSTGRGTPSLYRYWMKKAKCSDADRRIFISACEAFDAAYTHDYSDVISIEPIIRAARHSRKDVWEAGTLMLTQLAHTNMIARIAISNMANDKLAANRSRALFYLSDQYPREYCLDLLNVGVRDKSFSVAHVAAWKALELNLGELAEPISDRLKTVKKSIVRFELEMIVGLMRNGVYEYYNENGYTIVVSFPTRCPNLIVWPGCVAEGELQALGLAEIRKRIEESGLDCLPNGRQWKW